MGQKKSREIYIGGYNKEYFVDEMETTHITSVLVMLHDKTETLRDLKNRTTISDEARANIVKQIDCIDADIDMLMTELGRREDCEVCC